MKKSLLKILTLFFALCMTLGIATACSGGNGDEGGNDAPVHECVFDQLKNDANQHWYECDCGAFETKENHKGGNATCTQKAVCSVCGQSYGEKLDHEYDNLKYDENQHWYECDCGDKQTAENHKGGEATCEAQAMCTVCGQEYGEKLAHEYDNLKFDVNKHWYECDCGAFESKENHKGGTATCTEKAVCTVCSQQYGNKLDHEYDNLKYNETQHWYECDCGAFETKENHKGGEATCEQKAVCIVCSQSYGELLDHFSIGGTCKWCNELLLDTKLINGDTEYEIAGIGDCNDTDIVIPTTYNGKPITSIGASAFYNCPLTSIVLPDSIKTIGNSAFHGCGSLKTIVLPNGVSVGENAFVDCPIEKATAPMSAFSRIPKTALKVVVINGGKHIDEYTFAYCKSLTSVEIPKGVTRLEDYAFDGCTSLSSVTFDEGSQLSYIGSNAFSGAKFTSIEIPNGVKEISHMAFLDCTLLESIEIPNGVETIGQYLFKDCTSLKSIEIPNSVIEISYGTFEGCESLQSIVVDSANPNYKTTDGNLYSKDGKTLIKYGVGKKATLFNIPDSVTSIGYGAFAWCDSLQSIIIPNSVTSIGEEAFAYCESLKTIFIPNSVTSMGESVFWYSDSLTRIYCEATSRPSGWASNWNGNYSAEVVWGNNSDIILDGIIYCITTTGSATVVGQGISTTTANIQSSITYKGNTYAVTSIGEEAFAHCDSLQSVFIPNSVTSIGEGAFSWCNSLQSVVIGDSVEDIGSGAFFYCEALQSVVIGNSVENIGDHAFAYCTSLQTIKIPNSVENIGADAFYDCTSLTAIYCEATSKPIGWDSSWYNNPFAELVWGYTED